MLIVGYCFGIRSERRLCEEVHLNLAYRWFCRLGLDGDVPDHSTFSKNRHGRFRDSDLLRKLFETTVRRCMAEGLVGGEGFAVDASLIKADANRQRSAAGRGVDCRPRRRAGAVREYLAVLDDAAFGAATPVTPKFVSPADPAARWTGAHGGHAFFAYSTNYLIDLDHAVIVDVEATTADPPGRGRRPQRTMIERTQERFGLWPERLAADSRLRLGRDARLAGPRARDRAAHPGVRQVRPRATGPSRAPTSPTTTQRDVYVCPGGKRALRSDRSQRRACVDEDGTMRYRASKHDCDACALKPRCCPNTPARKITALDPRRRPRHGPRHRHAPTPTSPPGAQRKKVEMLFAHLKRILRLDRLRLRGPNGARDEFLLAATAQNLRKLAKLVPIPKLKPA